jgi:hypothetical protein
LEALAAARIGSSAGTLQRGYEAMIIGATNEAFFAEPGIAGKAQKTLKCAPRSTVFLFREGVEAGTPKS